MPRSRVSLPAGVTQPFGVYVNGVPQTEGDDYRVLGREIVFERALAQEGKVATWRWLVGAMGVGTYRANETVDIRYEAGGRTLVAHAVAVTVEPSGP